MDAWEKFKKDIKKYKIVNNGDSILIAVSGGPDSICMLHLFWRLKKIMPINITTAYIDHGLRKQSKKEQKMIIKHCSKMSIPVIIRHIPVKKYSKTNKLSIETSGRILRYEILIKLANEYRCNKIATGHTANDNAETIVMWLIRGTGSEGLAGIPMTRREGKKLKIIRPILSITREEVLKYNHHQKLSYSIDKSNYSLDFTRNRIRHKLIPILKSFNPRIIEHLYNLSQIISNENDFIYNKILRIKRKLIILSKNGILLDLKRFFGYNKMIQLRILKDVLPERLSYSQIERLNEWILMPGQKEFVLSRHWHIHKSKNRIIFKKTLKN